MGVQKSPVPALIYNCSTSAVDNVEGVRKAIHEAVEIKCFYEGTSTLLLGTQTVTVKAGDVVVINPYEFHATIDRGEEGNTGKYHLFMVPLDFFSGCNLPEMDLPDLTASPDRLIEKIETQGNVLRGIDSLPETLREAMVLRHVKDMPYEQIAEVLDCKIGTVKSRIARGRELLREYLLAMDTPEGEFRSQPGSRNH